LRPHQQWWRRSSRPLSAEEAIAGLRVKIERLGPVNMMAIEQHDELETRHTFLTTQAQGPGRFDLADERGDHPHRRDDPRAIHEAFSAINRNFQTVQHAVRGGRAGLTLLDENDPLESGIEIVAQPPANVYRACNCSRAARKR